MAQPLAALAFTGNARHCYALSLSVTLCLLLAACGKGTVTSPAPTFSGPARVIDGDTIVIGTRHIRLFGVDAFEHDQSCGYMACGQQGITVMNSLVAGNTVTCAQQDIDKYGRTVAICTAGGHDLGQEMVRRGLAVSFRSFSHKYVADEDAARNAHAGAWAHGFDSPLKFRKAHPRK